MASQASRAGFEQFDRQADISLKGARFDTKPVRYCRNEPAGETSEIK